jgi:hypothetical protein
MPPRLERIANGRSEDVKLVKLKRTIRVCMCGVTDIDLDGIARTLGDFDTRNGAGVLWICRNYSREHSLSNLWRYHPSFFKHDVSAACGIGMVSS